MSVEFIPSILKCHTYSQLTQLHAFGQRAAEHVARALAEAETGRYEAAISLGNKSLPHRTELEKHASAHGDTKIVLSLTGDCLYCRGERSTLSLRLPAHDETVSEMHAAR